MENVRPSSLRGDIWRRSHRGLLARGEFTKGGDGPPQGRIRRGLFVLRRRPVLPYVKVTAVFGSKIFLDDMDVSGTIGAILSQKSKDIFSIRSDALVFEAIEMMDEKNVGALLVMDGDRLNGIISERDYTRKVFLRGKRSRETKVSEIMSTNVTVTHPREPVEKCLRLMTDKHIRHLPVVEGDQVVGVISIGDLVKHVISCQQAAIAHLENYIHGGYAAG
jgi:CBS domain-containing protein